MLLAFRLFFNLEGYSRGSDIGNYIGAFSGMDIIDMLCELTKTLLQGTAVDLFALRLPVSPSLGAGLDR